MQTAHILKAPSIRAGLYAAQNTTLLPDMLSLLLSPSSIEINGARSETQCEDVQQVLIEEEECRQIRTFVHSCVVYTTLNKHEWTILRLLRLGRE